MSEITIPHPIGLLLALLRVRAGRVSAHGSGTFTDNGHPFPGILIPFLRELFDHGQVRLDADGTSVITTGAGDALVAELEASDEAGSVEAALSLLDPEVWEISSIPGQVKITRSWTDKSVDTVLVFGLGCAFAWRDDPAGRVVWREGGSALAMAAAVVVLPPPGAPGTPSTPLPDHTAGLF